MIRKKIVFGILLVVAVGPSANSQRHHQTIKVPPACDAVVSSGALTSWTGQPGYSNQHKSRMISQGMRFTCSATAVLDSPVAAACALSFQKEGQFLLSPGATLRAMQDDSVILACNGMAPSCCAVHLTVDHTALSAADVQAANDARFSTKDDSQKGPRLSAAARINSTTDDSGKQEPATVHREGTSAITCVSASGDNLAMHPASCHITAPNFAGAIEVGQTIATKGEGLITLTCLGQAPLRCSAVIKP